MLDSLGGFHSASDVGRMTGLAIIIGLVILYVVAGSIASYVENRKRKKDAKHGIGA